MSNKTKLKSLKTPIVMYNVTEDCQLRCKHCYNESGGHKFYTPEWNNKDMLIYKYC